MNAIREPDRRGESSVDPASAATPILRLVGEGVDPRAAFADLVARVAACRRCPTMAGRWRVLGEANGPLGARVLFVAEAPGRLGAERSGVPLTFDQTGRNFDRLLAAAGIPRSSVFVTNAVLCNPRDDRGRNRAPFRAELARCVSHLVELLDLVGAPFIVPLGATALCALDRIEPHHLTLRTAVGQPFPWRGRRLVPLYHPGPRAMLHRPFERQVEDYRRLVALLRG